MTTLDEIAEPAMPPVGAPEWTETTRLMCAAAYLDSTFAQEVIEEIVEEPFRAVQVPAGVDLVPVVKHCLAAQRQKAVRDMVLLATFVVCVLLSVKSFSSMPLLVGFVLGWLTVAADLWVSTFSVATKQLSAAQFKPEDAPVMSDATTKARVEDLAQRQRGDLVVYSGFNPFSSAGLDLEGWSFVIDLRKGADRFGQRADPVAFDPAEMYDAITASLTCLNIEGFSVQDRVFVNGTDIRDDRGLLPDVMGRPAADISPEQMTEYIRTPTHKVRHYRRFQIVDWRGELVVTLFLRFAINNERLFAELSPFVLLPMRMEYRRIDGIDQELSFRRVASIAWQSAKATFPLGVRSFATAIRPLTRMRHQAQRERQVRRDYFYDYGSRRTALDRARSNDYARYFQKLDKEMHTKLLDRVLLDSIVEFLDAHGIDTGELVQRRDTIINHGIMVPGGSVNAHNIAVGQNASIISRLRGGGASPPKSES
ncbi:MAG TPA: hypothetical protein VFY45_12050 [Baekduia sp.]|nr:hypothetical protein [Baekduia sp.]